MLKKLNIEDTIRENLKYHKNQIELLNKMLHLCDGVYIKNEKREIIQYPVYMHRNERTSISNNRRLIVEKSNKPSGPIKWAILVKSAISNANRPLSCREIVKSVFSEIRSKKKITMLCGRLSASLCHYEKEGWLGVNRDGKLIGFGRRGTTYYLLNN